MPSLIRIDPAAAIDLAPAVAADRLVSGDPRQGAANAYSDPSGQFHAGVWAAEPATWRVHYTEQEYCEILEGRIRMRHEDGHVEDVGAGDRFVVPAGWKGTWEVLERARKVYVIFDPPAR